MPRCRLIWAQSRKVWSRLAGSERLIGVMALVLLVAGAVLAALSGARAAPLPLAVALACAVAGGAISYQWLKMVSTLPRTHRGYPYVIKEKRLLYRYYSDRRMHQRKEFLIEARQNGLSLFQDRYKWSGQGRCMVTLSSPGATLLSSEEMGLLSTLYGRVAPWDGYVVCLDRPLRRGEQQPIVVDWDLDDVAGSALLFYATTVHVPTGRLSMRAQFHRPIVGAKGIVFSFTTSTTPVLVFDLPIEEETNAVSWQIERPELGYRYVITWDWWQ